MLPRNCSAATWPGVADPIVRRPTLPPHGGFGFFPSGSSAGVAAGERTARAPLAVTEPFATDYLGSLADPARPEPSVTDPFAALSLPVVVTYQAAPKAVEMGLSEAIERLSLFAVPPQTTTASAADEGVVKLFDIQGMSALSRTTP